jgi:transcriptional regulator with XRE-family HTH domain
MAELKSLRRRLYMTQSDLARELGVSPQAVSAWETGSVQPRPRNLKKLVRVLGVPPEEVDPELRSTREGR